MHRTCGDYDGRTFIVDVDIGACPSEECFYLTFHVELWSKLLKQGTGAC